MTNFAFSRSLTANIKALAKKKEPLVHTFSSGILVGPLSGALGHQVVFIATAKSDKERKATITKLSEHLKKHGGKKENGVVIYPRLWTAFADHSVLIMDNPMRFSKKDAILTELTQSLDNPAQD